MPCKYIIFSLLSVCLLVSQGPAVSSWGLVTHGFEQRQHHMAHHPTKRQGGPQNSGRCRIHAPRQTDADLMTPRPPPTHTHSPQSFWDSDRPQGHFLLKCLETYFWCYYFVFERPSYKERLVVVLWLLQCHRIPEVVNSCIATPPECNWRFLHEWLIFKTKKENESCICIAVVNASRAVSFTCHYSLLKWGLCCKVQLK